jgi:hypothetical protein
MSTTSERTYTAASGADVVGNVKRSILRRGWRKATWAIIAWSSLIIAGAVLTTASATSRVTNECQGTFGQLGMGGSCHEMAQQAGTAQFEHIMKIGVVGFLILSIVWFMTRPQNSQS